MELNGKKVAQEVLRELKARVEQLATPPTLTVLQVGDHPASTTYIKMKKRACSEVGITPRHLTFPSDVQEKTLLEAIKALNEEEGVSGILLQLPLPPHLSSASLLEAISPEKDVDGFHPLNLGRLLLGLDGFIPCTPLGIHTLLKRSGITVAKKRVVIVGRSHIVGLPLANLWMQKKEECNATVTVVHSHTPHLEEITARADILVAAIGVPRFIQPHMVREGAVVIDVGINKEEGRLIGDVAFDAVAPKCYAITPVPGGVGPMTVAMLLHNTLKRCV